MEEEQNAPANAPAQETGEHVRESQWQPPDPRPELIGIIDKGYEHPNTDWVNEGRELSESDGHG